MRVQNKKLKSLRPLGGTTLGLVAGLFLSQAALAASTHGPEEKSAAETNKETAVLPGGASALNETFQDWQVACASPQGTKRCVVNQVQADSKTKQRMLALELQPNKGGAAGVLVMPFGLDLDKGVILKAGDAQVGSPLRFKTCVPQGCLVPLSLDQKTLDTLTKSTALAVLATAETGQSFAMQVSLKGLAPALSRAASLAE